MPSRTLATPEIEGSEADATKRRRGCKKTEQIEVPDEFKYVGADRIKTWLAGGVEMLEANLTGKSMNLGLSSSHEDVQAMA